MQETKIKRYYTENEVISLLDFLIDNIYVEFEGQSFQQIIIIPIATIFVPPLAKYFSLLL